MLYVELLVFPHTGDLFSVCCFFVSVSMYQWPVLGSGKCVAVFPHAMDLFSGLLGVSFILLLFPSTNW